MTAVDPNTLLPGTLADANETQSKFDPLYNNLGNGNIAAGADIEVSKLETMNSGEIITGSSSGTPVISTFSAIGGIPVGTILPFYDFNGTVSFDTGFYAYCDGSVISDVDSPINGETLPDLSNRYLVGFGTEGGGDVGTAPWATPPVGNADHQVDLQHSHTVDSHTHDVNIAAFDSASAGSHSHTVNSHDHDSGNLHAQIYMVDIVQSPNGQAGAWVNEVTVTSWNSTLEWDLTSASANRNADVEAFTTATNVSGDTGTAAPGTDSQGAHVHSIDAPNTTSTGTAPGTDNQLSTTQSIQPRSIRVRWIIRYK